MSLKKTVLFFITLITLIVCTLSCEIGLGEAVDTQEPKISTMTPPVDAIIRGKFAIGGTWLDDGDADKVVVQLKRADIENSFPIEYTEKTVTTTVGKGTWSVIVDPLSKEKPVKDGKYQITATLYDKAGHATKEARLITIDNTAPLIVLDRPASKPGESLLDAYGQKISILGRAADDNEVDSIDINFFKKGSETPIHTVRKTGVSNTIDETVAEFGDENYKKIYGDTKNGTEHFTCSIQAYDKSRKYPAEYPVENEISGEDLLGNRADHYYLFSELSSTLLKDHTVNQLYKMLSGNFQQESERATENADISSVLSQLHSKEVARGEFTINPENNPVYSVSGYDTVTNFDDFSTKLGDLTIKNGSRISVDVTAGIDGYALNKPFFSTEEGKEDNYKVVFYPCKDNSIEIDTTKASYVIPNEDLEVKFQGGAYKVIVPLTANRITEYGNYVLKIEGKDSLGNELIASGGENNNYVFSFAASGIPPTLYVKKIDDYYNANKALVIEGNIKAADNTPTLKILLDGTEYVQEAESNPDTTKDKYLSKETGKYKYTFNKLPLAKDGQYIVKVTADAGSGIKADTEVSFIYDTTAPTGEVASSVRQGENDWYKSNQIPLSLIKVTDGEGEVSGIDFVLAKAGNELAALSNRDGAYKGNINVANEGKNTIEFTLQDYAGNSKKVSATVKVDTIAPTVKVNDIYVTEGGTNSPSKKDEVTKLIDGISDVTVELDITDGTVSSGITGIKLSKLCGFEVPESGFSLFEKGVSGNIHTVTIDKKNFEGKNALTGPVEFQITDKAGNVTTLNAFNMTIDKKGPESTIGIIPDADLSTKDIDVNKKIILRGTLSDDNGLNSAELQYKKNGTTEWKKYGDIPLDYNWELEVDTEKTDSSGKIKLFEDGQIYELKVKASDKAGYSSESAVKTVKINQDSDRPIISFNDVDLGGMNDKVYAKLKTISITGTIFDDDGVTKLEYKVGDGDSASFVNIPVENGSWTVTFKKEEQGEKNIFFKVTEGSNGVWTSGTTGNMPKLKGKESKANDYSILHIFVDNQRPILEETMSSAVTKGDEKGNVVLGGTVSDNIGFPVNSIVVTSDKIKDKTYTCDVSKAEAGKNKEWTVSIPKDDSIEGNHVISITVADKAGNEASLSRNIKVDRTAPEGTVSIDNTVSIKNKADWYKTNQLKVKANITTGTGSGMSTVTAEVGESGEVITLSPNKEKTEYTGYVIVPEGASNTINFKIADVAGNVAKQPISDIKVDTTMPTVELKSIDKVAKAELKGAKLVNGSRNVTVVITASDNNSTGKSGSGIASVSLKKLVNKNITNVNGTIKDGNYEIIIESKNIPKESDSGSVIFEITDNAGNKTELNAFTMTVDTEKPKAEFGTIFDADTTTTDIDVNGSLTLNGIASDNMSLKSVDVQYAENGVTSSTWSSLSDTKVGGTVVSGSNWSATFDTTKLAATTATKYDFRVVALDEAGNKFESEPKTLNINQSSDRPVVSFINIDVTPVKDSDQNVIENGTTELPFGFELRKLTGSIADDDKVDSSTKAFYKVNDAKDWTPLPLNNAGIWNIVFADDGKKSVKFKVIDSTKKEFTSDGKDSTNKLDFIRFAGNADITSLNLNVDTEAPTIGEVSYEVTSDGVELDENKWEHILGLVGKKLGGTVNKNLYLKVNASDSSGIGGVVLSANAKEYKLVKEPGTTGKEEVWKTKSPVDIRNDFNTGTFPVTIKVFDAAGKESTSAFNITVDNTAPTLLVDSHRPNDYIRANFLLKGTTDDSDCIIKYQLTTDSKKPTDWSKAKEYGSNGNKQSWGISFDKQEEVKTKAIEADGRMHDLDQKEYFLKLYSSSKGIKKDRNGAIVTSDGKTKFKDVLPFYFHFQVTDTLGNVSYNDSLYLRVDPQGDMPTVNLVYPTKTDKGENPTVSGIIRLQGTADDDKGIDSVYMQIDPAYDGKTFEPWSDNHKPASGKTLQEIYSGKIEKLTDIGDVIKISSGLSWTFSINEQGELNGKTVGDKTENSTIAIRFLAKDKDEKNLANPQNVSSPTEPFVMIIDSGSPKIGSSVPFTVNQYGWIKSGTKDVFYSKSEDPSTDNNLLYEDSGCNKTASGETWDASSYTKAFNTIEYTNDMWLKGEWWLKGSIEDENGINVTEKSSTIEGNNVKDHGTKSSWGADKTATSGYIINYKIGSKENDKFGKLNYKLIVKDGQDKISEKTFIINYDNKKPTVPTDAEIQEGSSVFNQNGFFKVESKAEEKGEQKGGEKIEESGFDKVVFYFESGTKVFDTYLKKGSANQTIDKTSLKEDMGLLWRTVDYCTVNGSSITLSSVPANLHKGGLVKVQGALYTIKNISETTIDLNAKLPDISGNVSANFAIGHVVDHNGTESIGTKIITANDYYGYYEGMPDDDGDKMIEKVSSIGTTTLWNGYVNSNNIPDGPAKLTYVIFDKAGNYSVNTVNVKIENNAPRLASLRIWNDYNLDGNEDEATESSTYYYKQLNSHKFATDVTKELIVSGDGNGPEANGSAYMVVKENFVLIPEIIGGNGNLHYTYKRGLASEIATAKESEPANLTDGSGNIIKGRDDGIDEVVDNSGYLQKDQDGIKFIKGEKTSRINVDLKGLPNNIDGNNPTWFEYTIYDSGISTGTTKNENSLSSTFKIALNLQHNDTEAPVVGIDRFQWSNTETGLVNNIVVDKENYPLGHIELEGDLPISITESTTLDLKLKDNDPKVSGKIKITGTASDNIRLGKLHFTFPSIDVIATYGTDGKWTYDKTSTDWSLLVENEAFTGGEGNDAFSHKVKWTLTMDTAALTYNSVKGAGLDQVFNVKATDSKAKETSADTELSKYKMDVVPYIAGINTSLANFDVNNPTVYTRSAKGHYSVASNETITFVGFNLDGATYNDKVMTSGSSSNCVVAYNKYPSFVQLNVNADVKSGPVELKVGGIPTLNNINNNDAKGTVTEELTDTNYKTYAYNRQPNGSNNNRLTDDVVIDVWEFNNIKKASSGMITEPIMHINPTNDLVCFAFNEDPVNFYMSNGSTNSFQQWQRSNAPYTSSDFIIDSSGKTHGVTVNTDMMRAESDGEASQKQQAGAARMTYMYGNWGASYLEGKGGAGVQGTFTGINCTRLECIGIPAKGTELAKILTDRFPNPSLAASTHVTNTGSDTHVYLAYYDKINHEIRFRWGNLNDAKAIDHKFTKPAKVGNQNAGYSFNQFADSRASATNGESFGAFEQQHARDLFEPKEDFYSVVVDSNSPAHGGEYVSIAVVPGDTASKDTVVMTWFDEDNNAWMYSYKTNPIGGDGDGKMKDTPDAIAGTWSEPITLKNMAGEYCKITVDSKKGVHVVAYDKFNADLLYVYMPSYNTYDPSKCLAVVDAAGMVGTNISIDTVLSSDGNNIIPYIGYYAGSIAKPKLAYIPTGVSTDMTKKQGAINQQFTQEWEVCNIPLEGGIRDDNINVAVWKDRTKGKEGRITAPTGTSSTGMVYGNNTANPLLGYAKNDGVLETAQMR